MVHDLLKYRNHMKRIRPFDTRQLEAFDMLCRTGSFTKTAKHL
mgnify:CR=1